MSTYSERMEPKQRWIEDGERLRLLIITAGLTQTEFGIRMGVKPDVVSRWCKGEQSFESYYLRLEMCDILGRTLDDLAGADPVETSLRRLQSVETNLRDTIREARDNLNMAQVDRMEADRAIRESHQLSLDAMTKLLPHASRALDAIGETVKLVKAMLHAEKNGKKLKTWAAILLGAAIMATGTTGCHRKKVALVPTTQITVVAGMTKR